MTDHGVRRIRKSRISEFETLSLPEPPGRIRREPRRYRLQLEHPSRRRRRRCSRPVRGAGSPSAPSILFQRRRSSAEGRERVKRVARWSLPRRPSCGLRPFGEVLTAPSARAPGYTGGRFTGAGPVLICSAAERLNKELPSNHSARPKASRRGAEERTVWPTPVRHSQRRQAIPDPRLGDFVSAELRDGGSRPGAGLPDLCRLLSAAGHRRRRNLVCYITTAQRKLRSGRRRRRCSAAGGNSATC